MSDVGRIMNSIGQVNRLNKVRLGVAAFVVGVLAVSVVVWVGVSALAVAASGDHGATAKYIRAEDLLARAQAAGIEASATAINGEAARIRGDCPSVVADAPHGKQLEELVEEVSAAVLFSGAAPDRSAMLAFARRISRLQWNDLRITKLVGMLASEERAIANLVIPDVCADLRAWVASRYRTLSRDTMRFLKQTNAIGAGVGAKEESFSDVISGLLARRESPSERRTVKYVQAARRNYGQQSFGRICNGDGDSRASLGLK